MKTKKNIGILAIIIVCTTWNMPLRAQNAMVWQKCFGGPAGNGFESMCKTPDGGYLLMGVYELTGGDFSGHYGVNYNSDIGLIKIDSNGNKLWSTYFGADADDGGCSILKGLNHFYYIIGNTKSYNFPNFHGYPEVNNKQDGFIVCINENGSMIWPHCYGGYGTDLLYSAAMPDSCYIYAAGITSNSQGGETGGNYDPDTTLISWDIFVCKINAADGSVVKSKRFGGTDDIDIVNKMIVTRNGNLLLLCHSGSSDIDFSVNYGNSDAWALLIDTSLNIISRKVFGGAKGDAFFDAVNLPNGDYMLYGSTQNTDTLTGNLDVAITSGNEQFLLIMTDSNFVPQWEKTYGCDYYNLSYYGSGNFVQTADKGFIMGGRAVGTTSCNTGPFPDGESIFVKVDSAGNQLFERHYGSDHLGMGDVVRSIIVTKGGGIIVGSIGHADAYNSCTTPGVDSTNFWNVYMLDDTWGTDEAEAYVQPVVVYPNPAGSEIRIDTKQFKTGTKLQLQMYDMQGRLAMYITLIKGNEDMQADIGRLQKGLYLGRLTDDKGPAVSFKILKE